MRRALWLLLACAACGEGSELEAVRGDAARTDASQLDAAIPDAARADAFDAGTAHGDAADADADGDAGPALDGSVDYSDASLPDSSSADASDPALPPMPTPAFLVGYNEAWFGGHYGTDLTADFDSAFVEATFDGIRAAGGHVVRLWLFELMQGVPLGATVPQTGPVSPAMLANLDSVLTAARRRALWVYVTALDGNAMPEMASPMRDYYYNLLNGLYGEEQAFDADVLAPMLDVLDVHRDVVWGFDSMNEIEAPRSRNDWPNPIDGPRGWMQRTAAFVHSHSPWLRVTVSVGWGNAQYDLALGFFSGLGLDFYDLHVYADDGTYSGQTDVCRRVASDGVPIILGEFGQLTHSTDDTLQITATAAFLEHASASCFSGALAWRFDATEPWLAYVRPDGSFRPAVTVMQAFGGP